MKLTTRRFPDREGNLSVPVTEYTLENENGISFSAMEYGAIVTDIRTPDREGTVESIVLGFSDLSGYIAHEDLYLGAVVGRVAGRIEEDPILLHGGGEFSKALWKGDAAEEDGRITFSYESPAGSFGFPGNLRVEVSYLLTENNTLTVQYRAETDEDTPLDVTNHTYFNLSGNLKSNLFRQVLKADADRVAELRQDLIPTGTLLPVSGTAFDFREGDTFEKGLRSDHPQNRLVGGYDHPFLFREEGSHSLSLSDPVSGRRLTLKTDAPAFVMYTCNAPKSGIVLKDGPLVPFAGAALETQCLPNAWKTHREEVLLQKGDVYRRETSWNFTVDPT